MTVRAHSLRFGAMGTRIEAHLFGDGTAGDVLPVLRAEVERVDAVLTLHRPSALTRLNGRLGAARSAAIDDPLLLDALLQAGHCTARTERLFDVTIPATRTGCADPPTWDDVELDAASARVRVARPLGFDFGGLGKGYALDLVLPHLRAAGVASALVTLGDSSILAHGHHPCGEVWLLQVPHPLHPDRSLVDLSLVDRIVSISSTVANGAVRADRARIRHPRSGAPVAGRTMAIVVDASGAGSEALSTALLLAGAKQRARLRTAAPAASLDLFDFDREAPAGPPRDQQAAHG